MAIHVVLYQPQIPANTGNIARTCAGTDTTLHLIRPLGFSTDDKMLKRAGLDYWQFVKIVYYDSLDEFYEKNAGGEFFYITKFGEKPYTTFDYSDMNKEYYFIFGSETTGLPEEVIENNKEVPKDSDEGKYSFIESFQYSSDSCLRSITSAKLSRI